MTAQAVQDAVTLLRSRLLDARTEITALSKEVSEIESALTSLGYGMQSAVPSRSAEQNRPDVDTTGASIAAAVKQVIDSERGPWTPTLVRDRLAGTPIQGDRTSEKLLVVIRTALYNLRKRGDAVAEGSSHTISAKWLTDAEAPVAAGASVREESAKNSSLQEGESGGTSDLQGDRDHHSDHSEGDHGLGRGAPLVRAL